MGTALTGLEIRDTYDALIKISDNTPITTSAKYLSDGLGNDSVLTLSTTSVGVGGDTSGTVSGVTINAKFCVKSEGSVSGAGFVYANDTTAANGSVIYACRSRGTLASPTAVVSGDRIASLIFAGNDGTDLALAAQINIEADGTVGANDMPGRITFLTTPDGTQAPTEKMRIANDGKLKFSSYGSGTITGTPAYNLGVDASGNVIELPGGVIDGSGTASYIPKWTDANTLGDSLIYDSGTNIGIGTTSPAAPLHTVGTVEANGSLYRGIFGGSSAQDADMTGLSGGNGSELQLQSPSTTRGSYLTIGGGLASGEALGGIGFYNSNNTDGKRLRSYLLAAQEGATANEQGGYLSFGTAADAATTPTERMRITSAGLVGIGTSSPNRTTEIVGGSGATLGVSTSANGASLLYGRLAMYSTAGSNSFIDYGGEIRSYSGAGIDYSDLRFYTAAGAASTEKVRITSAGNVGIGTSSPTSPLQVAGSTSVYNGAESTGAISAGQQEVITTGFNLGAGESVDISTITITSATSWKAIVTGGYANNLEGGSLTSPSLEVELDNSSATVAVGSVNLLFSRNGTTGKLQATNSSASGRATFVGKIQVINYPQSIVPTVSKVIRGNVGIGTSSPATNLDVRGIQSSTIRVGSTSSAGAGDEFANLEFYWGDPDAAEVKAKIYSKNVGNIGPGGGGAADLLFATTPAFGSLTERLRITSTGAVGIGGTPRGWTSAYSVLEMQSIGALSSTTGGSTATNLTNGAYFNGTSWLYDFTGVAAARLVLTDTGTGAHVFQSSAKGTADGVITWNERARIDNDGLKFNGDTAAANALDDYEEGTWTPAFQTGSYSYNFQVGKYTKIGNVVTANFVINWSANNLPADTSAMQISLPFATSSATNFRSTATIGYVSGITLTGVQLVSAIGPNSTSLDFYDLRSGITPLQILNSGLAAGGGEIQLSISYLV